MPHPVVAVHPARVDLLARALADAAADVTARSLRVGALLARHGDTLRPGVDLARIAAVLSEQAVAIHRLGEAVRAWQAEGRLPAGVAVLRGPVVGVHREPAASVRAARVAVGAYLRGDRDAFIAAARDRADDPVFASMVLDRLGAARLVTELDLYGYAWGAPASGERGDVVEALAALLATTSRSGAPALSASTLADEARAQGVPLAVIGLLFARCHRWDPAFVASVVDEVVVPLNHDILGGLDPSAAQFGRDGDRVDARTLVLATAAADARAARRVVLASDLGALLEAEVGYLDDGDAAGRLLVTATRPETPADLATLPPVVVRVVAVVDALDEPAPVVRDHLGAVAAPWIEAFGSDAFDSVGLGDLLPGLDGASAGRFLEVAMASSVARDEITAATWGWAARSFAVLGPAPDPVAAKRVADVVRAVTDAGRRAEGTRLASADARDAHNRATWNLAISVAAGMVPLGPASGAALSGTATVVGGRLVEQLIPEVTREVDYLRDAPAAVASEQRALEYLVLAVLWDQRSSNGLFGDDAPPLLDEGGRVRPYPSLSVEERAAFDRWLLDAGRRGSPIAAIIDAVGEEFGKSGADPR